MPPIVPLPPPTNLPRERNMGATSTDPQGRVASLERQMQQMSKNIETSVAQNEQILRQIPETPEKIICLQIKTRTIHLEGTTKGRTKMRISAAKKMRRKTPKY
jgi:hypothetical protein